MLDVGGPVGTAALEAAITALDAALDTFAGLDLTAVSSVGLTEALRRLEVSAGRHGAVQRHLVAEVDTRGVAAQFCAGTTSNLLRDLLRITSREAGVRVAQARDYGPRRALTGEPLEPVLPILAAALDSGAVSLAHASVITKLLTELPAAVERVHGVAVQHFLLEHATHMNPTQLAQVAQRLTDTLNPDGKYTDEADHDRRRSFELILNPDGSAKPAGHLTPELTAALRPVLDSLSAPVTADGMRDERTAGQRRHDALLDITLRLLRSGTLPDTGGTPVTILLTMTETQAAAHATGADGGLVTDGYGTHLSLGRALRLAAEAAVIPVVLTVTGGILSYGRTLRLATPAQRRALTARDHGCCFPGCTKPAAWTEVHHIIEWLKGGNTDIDNLCLLCPYHHRHFEAAGWTVRMHPQDQIPEWIPPAWIDPDRQPRRNTAHTPALVES